MSSMRILVAICATVLLAAGLGGQFADAGIKSFFSSEKSYVTLANHLYKATQSAELADNTKAAGSLLSEHPNSKQDVIELVHAFGSLKDVFSEPESLCSKSNLANLRRVAEGLRDGGNLGPKKITGAVLRLNKIVIEAISDAYEVCSPYLTEKWPEPWWPLVSEYNTHIRIENLDGVATSYLYEGFVGSVSEVDSQTESMSVAIRRSEQQAANPSDPNDVHLGLTEDKNEIHTQLVEYVYDPCSEFVRLEEAKEVLAPFNDMLMSWFVVSTGLVDEYYDNKGAYIPQGITGDHDKNPVKYLAFSYRACQRFLATPAEDLAKRISKFRRLQGRDEIGSELSIW